MESEKVPDGIDRRAELANSAFGDNVDEMEKNTLAKSCGDDR